ncbi:MAG: hypothetical protein ACOX8L_01635 [Candidatus Methanomethylophilaceae archaeon]
MIIAGRDREYGDLPESLRKKRVLIWTCNTCVRICGGVGGTEAAERLASKLSEDGIEITGVLSVSASCIASKVRAKCDSKILSETDVIFSLTCPLGAVCAGSVLSKDVFNPLEIAGIGYMDEEGNPITVVDSCEYREIADAEETAEEMGIKLSPFV